MLYLETEAVELKKCLTDSFEKEVVAFLNSRDGKIYIGIDNEGEIIGVSNPDEILRKISDIISNNILPNPTDFITVETSKKENKTIIVVHVHRGTSLYYINKYGRSSKGCYIRVGTSCRSMSEEQIEREFNSYILSKTDISQIESTRKSFSFKSLKIYYNEKKYHINDRFFEYNLGLKNKDGKYSLLAELLSDENRISIKIAKFQGKDKSVLIEKSEYGYQCILVAIDRVLNRLEAENYTMSLIDGKKRIDKRLLDMNSVREVFINSIAHNDWTKVEPAVYIFEDRIEIISYGGLPNNQTKEMFYQGISTPRNKSLIRILSDLDYVEQTGHGIPDVIKIYGKEVFDIQEKYINVTLPFDPLVLEAHNNLSLENELINKNKIIGEEIVMNDTIGEEIGEEIVMNGTIGEEIGVEIVMNGTIGEEIGEEIVTNGTIGEEIGEEIVMNSAIGEEIGEEIVMNSAIGEEIGEEIVMNSAIGEEIENKILQEIFYNNTITVSKIAKKLSKTYKIIRYNLEKLCKAGKLTREGSTKTGKWIINIKQNEPKNDDKSGVLNCEVGALNGEIGALNGEVGALNDEIGALNGEVGALNDEVGALNCEVGALNDEVGALNCEIGALNGEVGALNCEVGALNELEKREINIEEKILELIKSNPKITIINISQQLLIPYRSVQRHIFSLKEKGLVIRIGSKKSGHYEIKD